MEAQDMMKTTDMLLLMRGIEKFYDRCMEPVRQAHGLSHIEIKIINFLYNNPQKDTAADISYLRMLPKGNVSQGVETLIKKGLLRRTPDTKDRRKIHLSFTAQADDIIGEIGKAKKAYQSVLLDGLSEDELEMFDTVNSKIMKNVFKGLERGMDNAE